MEHKEYTQLTDQELLEEVKKIKKNNTVRTALIGFLVGIALYSTIKNGIGFFTFFPLLFVFLLARKAQNSDELQKEIKSRNLNKK